MRELMRKELANEESGVSGRGECEAASLKAAESSFFRRVT